MLVTLGSSSLTHLLSLLLLLLIPVSADALTIYHITSQIPFGVAPTGTDTAANSAPTPYDNGLQAYNLSKLVPPPAPSGLTTTFPLTLQATVPQGASVKQSGAFFGFSVEMSVVNQVLGKNSTLLQVPFLNLMANIQQRVGRINVRVGGNTQETATLVPSTPDGKILEKDKSGVTGPTDTPPLIFTPDLLMMMANISALVNVHWYLGVPFNDTSHFRLQIVEQGQAILGSYLEGVQAGNEPDLYPGHGHRPKSYTQQDYNQDIGLLITALKADTLVSPANLLIAPSVSGNWSVDSIWDTGFVGDYQDNLAALAVEHYPNNNCGRAFPNSGLAIVDPQDILNQYLSHNAILRLLTPYVNTALNVAQQAQKPFLMFETNTASCGGFVGLSDAFVSALWGVDYGMRMAAMNFTGALFHIGGQSVSYNPFTPPPTNESMFHQWTVGPIYYSALVVAEAIGPTNTSQLVDISAASPNADSGLTPAYAIYENGALVRALLINFSEDPSGASTLQVTLDTQGAAMPVTSVGVKYLSAASVTSKGGEISWAGQTFGGNFETDGRPSGAENITTITCGTPGTCVIPVPAPGVALVFLMPASGSEVDPATAGAPAVTFSTTTFTKIPASLTAVPASVLSTSNGQGGSGNGKDGSLGKVPMGGTSKGKVRAASAGVGVKVGILTMVGGLVGAVLVLGMRMGGW